MPLKVVSRTFFVRQATRIARIPARRRMLLNETSSEPPLKKSAGAMSAESTAIGTKRRPRCAMSETCILPMNTMKDRRRPKVSSPTMMMVTQSHSCDISGSLLYQRCFLQLESETDSDANQRGDSYPEFQW